MSDRTAGARSTALALSGALLQTAALAGLIHPGGSPVPDRILAGALVAGVLLLLLAAIARWRVTVAQHLLPALGCALVLAALLPTAWGGGAEDARYLRQVALTAEHLHGLPAWKREILYETLGIIDRRGGNAAVRAMVTRSPWIHEVGHGLGMYLAEKYGVERAFGICEGDPLSGCSHGTVFGHLGMHVQITEENWPSLCTFIPDHRPDLEASCWHTISHGLHDEILSGDLKEGLRWCDRIGLESARPMCVVVAFTSSTEKAAGHLRRGIPHPVYTPEDPFRPCNDPSIVPAAHQYLCFQQQIRALKYMGGDDWRVGAAQCQNAPSPEFQHACARGLGAMWNAPDGHLPVDESLDICRALGRDDLYASCALNVLRNPLLQLSVVTQECLRSDDETWWAQCAVLVGSRAAEQVARPDDRRVHCAQVPLPHRSACLRAARLQA